MRITAAGKVGIGVAAPVHTEHLNLVATSAGATLAITFQDSGAAINGGNHLGDIVFGGSADGTNWGYGAKIRSEVQSNWSGTTDTPADLSFHTVADGGNTMSQRMTIIHNGNVGIGTTAPDNLLHIFKASGSVYNKIESNDDSVGILLDGVKTSDGGVGIIQFYNAGDSVAKISADRIGANDAANLTFHTQVASGSQAQKMVITSAGNVGIGTTTPTTQATVNTFLEIAGGGNKAGLALNGYGNASRWEMVADEGDDLFFARGGSQKLELAQNGHIGAPDGSNIYDPSDRRLKQNVVDLTNCLSKINNMQGVSFNWIDGFCTSEKDKTLYGLIAQDLQPVDSNLVESFVNYPITIKKEGEENVYIEDTLRVNDKFIIPMLVEAIKELSAKVTTLENA